DRFLARQSRQLLAVCSACLARPVWYDAARRPANPTSQDRQLALAHHGAAPEARDESASPGRGRTSPGAEDGSARAADGRRRPRLQQPADRATGLARNAERATEE